MLTEHGDKFGDRAFRVALLATRISEQLEMTVAEVDTVRHAAELHEIGLIGSQTRSSTNRTPLAMTSASSFVVTP
jgi:response regulator RpfG family c-di-GMP phosphodiesterase